MVNTNSAHALYIWRNMLLQKHLLNVQAGSFQIPIKNGRKYLLNIHIKVCKILA